MRKKLMLILITVPFITLFGCDPPHSINFINNKNLPSNVTIIINPETENYVFRRFDEIRNGDSLIFTIEKNQNKNLHFGIGTWSEFETEELVKSLKQIKIENKDKLIVYKSKNEIRNLLNRDKEGFWWKTIINIEIE